MTFEDLLIIRQSVLNIAVNYGATNVRVFGSVVRNTAKPNSDVDILVDFVRPQTLVTRVAFKRELETLLGCSVDIMDARYVPSHMQQEIFKQALAL